MKKIRINILIDFYTSKLSDIANRVSVLAATAQQGDENPNFHKIAKEARILFADYIVFKAKARKFIELIDVKCGQMNMNCVLQSTSIFF